MRYKGQGFDLKSFREKKKLSQKDISEAVNLPQSFLSAIENGKKSAPDSFIDDLARIYNEENISDYITDRKELQEAKYQYIKQTMVNSEGVNLTLTGIKSDVASELIKELGKAFPNEFGKSFNEIKQLPEHQESTIQILLNLLMNSESRFNVAQQRIQELEKEIFDLKSKLPRRNIKKTY